MRSSSFISDRNTRCGTSSFPGLLFSSWTTCTRTLGGEKEGGERGREEGGEGEQGGMEEEESRLVAGLRKPRAILQLADVPRAARARTACRSLALGHTPSSSDLNLLWLTARLRLQLRSLGFCLGYAGPWRKCGTRNKMSTFFL